MQSRSHCSSIPINTKPTFVAMAAPTVSATTGFVLGVASHLQLFKGGEWERYAPKLAAVYAGALVLSSSVPLCIAFAGVVREPVRLSVFEAFLLAFAFWISYFLGLFGSLVRYRLWSHPLKSFPGPTWAKITGFWSIKVSVSGFKFPRRVQELHRAHGDFVRIRGFLFLLHSCSLLAAIIYRDRMLTYMQRPARNFSQPC